MNELPTHLPNDFLRPAHYKLHRWMGASAFQYWGAPLLCLG